MKYRTAPLIAAALMSAACSTRQQLPAAHGDAVEAAVQYAEREAQQARTTYVQAPGAKVGG